MLSRQIVAIAPFRPRPEIIPHPRITRDFQREVRMRGAVSTLAVRDYLIVRIEPDRFELRAQLYGRLHSSICGKRCRPVLMVRSGNRAAVFRADALAEVFRIAANVEDLHVATPESLEQMRIRRQNLRPRTEMEIRRRELLDVCDQLLARRRLEPAIEHSRLWMPRVFERPQPSGLAHSGFILIKHDGLASRDSERRKYPLELRIELRDTALGRISMMKREGIEVPRAAKMPAVEILGGPRVNEYHVSVVAMLAEPLRINNFFRIHYLALSVYPDRITNRAKSTATEQVCQPRFDFFHNARTLIDERGIKLDHRRAGSDVQPCVLGAADAANADDRDFSASVRMDIADQLARANRQRTPAESSRMRRRNSQRLARDRSIARDDSVHAQLQRGLADSKHLVAFQVRRNLHQHRPRRLSRLFADRGEQLAHLLRRLPVAQPRRVRRAHVDYDEIGLRTESFHQGGVIGGDPLRRRDAVGAEVEPNSNRNPRLAHSLDSRRDRLHPFARKAEPVDQRAALGNAPQARRFISRLRTRRNRTQLGEAEAECLPSANRDSILVHPGRESNRIVKIRAPQLDSELGPVARRRKRRHHRKHPQRQAMRILGIEAEQASLEKVLIDGVDCGNCAHGGSPLKTQSCNAARLAQSKRMVWIRRSVPDAVAGQLGIR